MNKRTVKQSFCLYEKMQRQDSYKPVRFWKAVGKIVLL